MLVHLDFGRGVEHLRRLAPHLPESVREAEIYFSDAALQFNRGELAPEDFLRRLATQLGIPSASLSAVATAWCDIFSPWPQMEEVAQAVLDAGHSVYLLSNTDPLHFALLREQMPLLERFSGLYLSFEAHRMKPNPQFFRGALQRFGLEPGQCAYLDDRPDHAASARFVGIASHVHDGDLEKVRRFLEERGALSPGPPTLH